MIYATSFIRSRADKRSASASVLDVKLVKAR